MNQAESTKAYFEAMQCDDDNLRELALLNIYKTTTSSAIRNKCYEYLQPRNALTLFTVPPSQ